MLLYLLIIHFHTATKIVHPKEQKGPITLWHSYKVRKTYCTNVVVTAKWLFLLDWCITTLSNWWMTNWLAPKWWLSKSTKAKGYVCLDMTKFLQRPSSPTNLLASDVCHEHNVLKWLSLPVSRWRQESHSLIWMWVLHVEWLSMF